MLQLVGKSIADLRKEQEGQKFTWQTTQAARTPMTSMHADSEHADIPRTQCQVFLHMLDAIEHVHRAGCVHCVRAVRPGSCASV